MFPTQFTGASFTWERKELNNILKINSGRDYKQLNSGNIPVYGTGGYMLSVNDKLSDADAVGIGRKGTIDKPLYLRAPFWTVDTLFYCTSKENSDVKFIYLLFQIINWKRYDESTGVPSLSKNTISSIKTYVPKVKEQDHISKLFFSLDNTLQLHERKCEELTLIKKSLLQKLFPKEDKIKPEIRYKNFSDAWEQRKLGDISKTKRGLTYKPSNIDNTGIRVLRSSNIKEDTFVISDNDVFVKESAVNIPFVKNGDILITAANGSTNLVGKHAIIRDIPKNSAVHGGFMLITTSKEYEFLNASMSSNWYKKFIKKYVAGGNGAIGNLRKNDLDNQKIYVPKKDEQEKIGNFFKMLDSLITLHQRKLEKLKQLKKFLLQNMFI